MVVYVFAFRGIAGDFWRRVKVELMWVVWRHLALGRHACWQQGWDLLSSAKDCSAISTYANFETY